MKTSELQGAALDWAVAKCEGIELTDGRYNRLLVDGRMSRGQEMMTPFKPSTDWAQAGQIIEREKIAIDWDHDFWNASTDDLPAYYSAETPLIAAMRCYVASKLGDEVDIPEELTGVAA